MIKQTKILLQEKEIESFTINLAKELGFFTYKIGIGGLPDRAFVTQKGITIYVEFKSHGMVPRKRQQSIIDKMRERGALVYVIDDIEKARALINSYVQK